jgi:serine/threonine-protein kinase
MAGDARDDFTQLDAWLDRLLNATPAERTQILAACTDTTLRDRLCTLLASESRSGPLDETPQTLARGILDAGSTRANDAQHGSRMGAYRIATLLGEGGSATVWLATRDDGTITHEVAVKCLKSGLATPEQRARFVREQQILARLAHPNIARLFDVGISVEGVPYIVMERIDGQPFTRWCDAHELGIDARIELFRTVLQAVAYAHQNLIVHRDLKPGNILVGADGAPKLLDFGIAKLLDGSEEATQTQARVLTPGYAAPEQFSGDAITTATDVYALGIVLYELLTGHRPARENNPAQELGPPSQHVQQWRRKPCEAGPHPADLAARCRGFADSAHLARVLRGDLDALILTATAPDPARRYATIAAFDADVEHYLLHRPLQARRASRAYRLRKYLLRHWVAIGGAAAVMLALLIGSGVALWQAREARRAAEHANAVQNFLLSVFETARPGPRADSLLTNRELVERSAQQLQTQMSREPQTDAPLRLALGRVYRKMGLLDQALPLLADAVATTRKSGDSALRADALEAHAHALVDAVQYTNAISEFNEALSLRRAAHASAALEAATLSGLGEAQSYAGEHDAAIASLRGALALLDSATDVDPELRQRLFGSLAVALRRADKPDNAIAIAEQAVADARASFGARTREEASALSVLGSIQLHAGRLRDAATSLRATVAIDLDVYHQPIPAHLYNLGTILLDLGDYAGAEQNLRDALAAQIAELGADHPAVGNYQKQLGIALHALGREAEAETVLRSALAHAARGYDAQSPEVADKRIALADVLLARAEVSQARQLYQSVIEAASMPGAGRLRLRALALAGLARNDAAVNDFAHAAQLAREALASAQPAETLEPQERIMFELDAGEVLLAAGQRDEAGFLFRKAELRCLTILPDEHPLRARALLDQARAARASGDIAHARDLLDSALPVLQRCLSAQHPLLVAAHELHNSLGSATPSKK